MTGRVAAGFTFTNRLVAVVIPAVSSPTASCYILVAESVKASYIPLLGDKMSCYKISWVRMSSTNLALYPFAFTYITVIVVVAVAFTISQWESSIW